MRTEYVFTVAQKAELRRIDDEIEQLNRQIFDLCMKRENIYMQARGRYIFDTEEDVRTINYAVAAGILNEPIIKKEGIVKMIFDERDEDER
jgi:hypothetical protein